MKKIFLGIVFLFFVSTNSFSQGWEKTYSSIEGIIDIVKSPDGYAFIGNIGNSGFYEKGVFFRTDFNGDSIISKEFAPSLAFEVKSIIRTSDNNYVVAGVRSYYSYPGCQAVILKIDSKGDTLWTRILGTPEDGWAPRSIVQTVDGGYIFYSYSAEYATDTYSHLVRLDANGNYKKHVIVNAPVRAEYVNMQKISEKELIVSMFDNDNESLCLIKVDTSLAVKWSNSYGGVNSPVITTYSVDVTNDEGIVVAGHTQDYTQGLVYRINSSGILQSEKKYDHGLMTRFFSCIQSSDNGFVFAGEILDSNNDSSMYIVKTNNLGDTIWTKKIMVPVSRYYLYNTKILETDDLGYLITGTLGYEASYLVKLDINGNVKVNTISGKLYRDKNGNCINDSGEPPLINWLVRTDPGNRYTLTDSNGIYSIKENLGSYTVTPVMKNSIYSQGCSSGSKTVNFNSYFQSSANNDFAINAIDCYLLKTDISTPFLRRCFLGSYNVSYQNLGTISANNVQLKVEFPDGVIPLSSSLPWITKTGNTCYYDLGTLDAGENRNFTIVDSVDCNESHVPLGSTHCVKATITPSSNCETVDLSWDKSSMKVEGSCVNNKAVFVITNTSDPGDGNMDGVSEYRVYLDNALDYKTFFQLTGGQTLTLEFPTEGKTVRLEADQRPGHPGRSRPRATVEGCASTSFGVARMAPEDDEDEFVEIDCQEVRGSYDPNDKSVKPQGITQYNYIPTDTDLEYFIRFQNTGTDTAFTVVVRDAISENLDITTLKMETASHRYTYKVISGENNIVEWRFANILLPDSNINEPKSHGYIKFKIKQKSGLPVKAVIENTADIYFDYNEAVITNTTRSVAFDTTILTPRLTGLIVKALDNNSIKVYPNPTTDYFVIQLEETYKKIDLTIYDLEGRVCKQLKAIDNSEFEVSREGLKEGVYTYKLYSEQQIIGAGKIVIIK